MRYRTNQGESGLQISARYGYQGLVAFLVGEGMIDEYKAGTTPLYEACEAGNLEVIQILLDTNPTENSSYINTTDINRRTPLHLATEND
jgi:ankyrin repeat protein